MFGAPYTTNSNSKQFKIPFKSVQKYIEIRFSLYLKPIWQNGLKLSSKIVYKYVKTDTLLKGYRCN